MKEHETMATTNGDETERAQGGRFARGNRGGPGRPAGQTITAELRRQADPEAIARFLLDVIDNPRASTKDRLRAAELVQDRLEGKATQTIDLHATAGPALDEQAALASLSEEQLRRLLDLDAERERILASATSEPEAIDAVAAQGSERLAGS